MTGQLLKSTNGSVLHLARVTIEATSPLSTTSGDIVELPDKVSSDGESESRYAKSILRDANGLPAIAGETLQGILSRHYAGSTGTSMPNADALPSAADLFGSGVENNESAARLTFGFGCVHDSDDQAVVGLLDWQTRDALLDFLMQPAPMFRDHNGLDHKHVVSARRKFSRISVPKGTRFSFELSLWGHPGQEETDRAALERLVGCVKSPAFRIGGATRSGYGRVVVARASYCRPDLNDPGGLRTLRSQPPSVPLPIDLNAKDAVNPAGCVFMTVSLTPLNPFRVGGHSPSATRGTPVGRAGSGAPLANHVNSAPAVGNDMLVATGARDPVIRWPAETGADCATLYEPAAESPFDGEAPGSVAFVVPGSSTKGVIAHRTGFHWRRNLPEGQGLIDVDEFLALDEIGKKEFLKRQLPEENAPADLEPSLAMLLGSAKQRQGGRQSSPAVDEKGRAGRVRVEDCEVLNAMSVVSILHNSIDRFTGGTINGALYCEEVLVGGTLTTEITLLPPYCVDAGEASQQIPDNVMRSFLQAVSDLCSGRLAIGAKSLGYCSGEVHWDGDDDAVRRWKTLWETVSGANNVVAFGNEAW